MDTEHTGDKKITQNSGNLTESELILEIIQIRLVKWMLLGGFLVLLWGQSNSWPQELVFSAVLLPLALLFSQRHYLEHHFALSVPDEIPVWDFLIANLLLTVGIASGKLLLISIGWVAVGIIFLKPTRMTLNWAEWFKIPLLWFCLLPFWLDFKNNSTNIIEFLVTNPLAKEFNAGITSWDYARFHFGILTSIIVMAATLKGGLFWKNLFVIPAVALVYSWIETLVPEIQIRPSGFQSFLSWSLIPGTIFLWSLGVRQIIKWLNLQESEGNGESHFKTRFNAFPLWLSVAVIAMQQYNLVRDNYFIENTQRINHVALVIWMGAILWLRYNTEKTNVDTRTRVILALGLAMLVTGEWTDINFLRHISLGMAMMAMCSWNRVWPNGLILTLLFTWLMIIPAGQTATMIAITGGFGREIVLALAILGNLFVISIFRMRKNRDLRILNAGDYEWLPSMRFSFLVMILLMSFQMMSSFSNSSQLQVKLISFKKGDEFRESLVPSRLIGLPGLNDIEIFRLGESEASMDLMKGVTLIHGDPVPQPLGLPSPLLLLKNMGWHPSNQHLIHQHPLGSAMMVDIQSLSQSSPSNGVALFWWISGTKAFHSHKKAQNILWSSWYYSDRDLSLVMLTHEGGSKDAILQIARNNDWFIEDQRELELSGESDTAMR